MFLPHDMAHIATRFSAFCSMIWPILLCDWAQISKEMQATRKKDIYLFAEKYISFFKKVLWFDEKSTIVLPKKYYRFAQKVLSFFERRPIALQSSNCQLIEEAWLFR